MSSGTRDRRVFSPMNASKFSGVQILLITLYLLLSPVQSQSDDTEIFQPQGCEKYRFIFIVDNSGSMSSSEFRQSKATIDATLTEVLASGLPGIEVAVVQYGSHSNAGDTHTYNVTVPFTNDTIVATDWKRAYGNGGTVQPTYIQDHQPASLARMRLDNVYDPGGALDITDATNVQFVFFTDALRDNSSRFCCTSLYAGHYTKIPSHVLPGFGEYNAIKDGSVLPREIKGQFTLLHIAGNKKENLEAGAAIASVGGEYNGAIEANTNDPEGSQTLPRRYIEGSLASTDTELILSLIRSVISDIEVEVSFTAPAISVDQFSRLTHRSDIYFAQFQPRQNPIWPGNLKRYKVVGNPARILDVNSTNAISTETGTFKDEAQSWWSAAPDGAKVKLGGAAKLLNPTHRKVTTYLGGSTDLLAGTNRLSVNNSAITYNMLGLTDANQRNDILNWTQGIDILDQDQDSDITDPRHHIGDPLHSKPLLVNYGGSASDPDSVVYFGTNEGMLHAIDIADGQELFSFIPRSLLPNLSIYFRSAQIENLTAKPFSSNLSIQNRMSTKFINHDSSSDSLITQEKMVFWEPVYHEPLYNAFDVISFKHLTTGKYFGYDKHTGQFQIENEATESTKWYLVVTNYGTWIVHKSSKHYLGINTTDNTLTTSNKKTTSSEYFWNFENPAPEPIPPHPRKPYGMDGSITQWANDTNKDNIIQIEDSEHSYIYAGMRRGGRGYVALDVSQKNSPKYLWGINGGTGQFNELGQTWSKPKLTRLSVAGTVKTVLVFGGGYDPAQDSAAVRSPDTMGRGLFIVDAGTGDLIWRAGPDIIADKTLPEMRYSMPASPAILDLNADGLVDQIYIGDMGGQVWRFDVDPAASSTAELLKGGVIASLSGTTAADNRRFFNTPDVSLIRYNNKLTLAVSIGSGFRAHPLDTTTQDRFYMIRQAATTGLPQGYGMLANSDDQNSYRAITESDLFDTTSNIIAEGDIYDRTIAESLLATAQGWLLDFEKTGEKNLAKSLTFNSQLLFTTYVPTLVTQACTSAIGGGYLYIVSILDGSPIQELEDSHGRATALPDAGIPTAPIVALISTTDENGVTTSEPTPFVGKHSIPVDTGEPVQRSFWAEQADF